MKDFWKKEWELFLQDMQELGDFFLQPVTFGKKDLMLRPTEEETIEKAETVGSSFWKKEKEAFLKDMEELGDFFLQPVTFK
ncbi:MAG: hypothetical protein PHR25_05595 [Clostridia bacterium]|nr:hypothetical protein [Clostridia bacterium]MDD4376239.1 hypothetical protein [Clostridia bacterium]